MVLLEDGIECAVPLLLHLLVLHSLHLLLLDLDQVGLYLRSLLAIGDQETGQRSLRQLQRSNVRLPHPARAHLCGAQCWQQ